jgi:hypothetical protein
MSSTTDNPPYRYELWKLDTQTLVHGRVTDERLDVHSPEMISRGTYEGYPDGYEWRIYRDQQELGRYESQKVVPAQAGPLPTS